MNTFITNWKTSITGIGTVATGITMVTHGLTVSPIDGNSIMTGIAAITSGIGLLAAKDGNVTGGTKQQ